MNHLHLLHVQMARLQQQPRLPHHLTNRQCADLPVMVRLDALPGRFRRSLGQGVRWAA